MNKVIESSGGKVKDLPMQSFESFGRSEGKLDSDQLTQHPVFGKFTISATGDYTMNIGFVPSFITLHAFESGQLTHSIATVRADYNICKAVDNASAQTEPALNTVVYISRTGITSATIKSYGKKVTINCGTYTRTTIVHWQAYP